MSQLPKKLPPLRLPGGAGKSLQQQILDKLNPNQQAPVLDFEGPSFILAGPGSGKTHTVISRAQYMIAEGVDPSKILLFTFTNKAAKEIKDRVVAKIGEKGNQITMGTYHSVCCRFLRQYAEHIGRSKRFSIYDTDDSLNVLKPLCKGMEFGARDVLEFISKHKSRMQGPSVALQNAEGQMNQLKANIYAHYQHQLETQDAMDFDDLIYYTILLFERNPDILKVVNAKHQYIVSDEFHDSSPRDIRLISLLGGERQNVCMILDDEQSIYRFRGADIEAVLHMEQIFPGLKTFVLQQNYRSTKSIVAASRSMIKKNENQLPKEIFTENEDGVKPIYFQEDNADLEAQRVLKLVLLLTNKYGLKYSDIAILYRMGFLSRPIEEAFIRNRIPYKIVGGTPFYARKEVKDILCYARLVYNPNDFEALKRVISVPKRGIGDTTLQKIYDYAQTAYSQPISFLQACREIPLKGKAGTGLKEFVALIDNLDAHMETDEADEFIHRIIDEVGYVHLLNEEESEASKLEDRLSNVQELVDLASGFDTLEEFLQNTSLNSQIDEGEEPEEQVCLQTLHSSKGLEYKAVIMISCNEGIIPHNRAINPKDVEEERRLFYVGMTRAEKYLFMTRPRNTMMQGVSTRSRESRFIGDIDSNLYKRY